MRAWPLIKVLHEILFAYQKRSALFLFSRLLSSRDMISCGSFLVDAKNVISRCDCAWRAKAAGTFIDSIQPLGFLDSTAIGKSYRVKKGYTVFRLFGPQRILIVAWTYQYMLLSCPAHRVERLFRRAKGTACTLPAPGGSSSQRRESLASAKASEMRSAAVSTEHLASFVHMSNKSLFWGQIFCVY